MLQPSVSDFGVKTILFILFYFAFHLQLLLSAKASDTQGIIEVGALVSKSSLHLTVVGSHMSPGDTFLGHVSRGVYREIADGNCSEKPAFYKKKFTSTYISEQ
jgi:hypothetical protein